MSKRVSKKLTTEDVNAAIAGSVRDLGYSSLKEEQKLVIANFLDGSDVFVALPTGYGKSLCYVCLPGAFDRLRSAEKTSIVVIVSPLVALMKDQVALYSSKGVSAAYISRETDYEMARGVTEGRYQLVYFSPESLLCSRKWRETLTEEPYASNLVAFVVDEAHCVKKWGDTFREEFSHLGEVRSLLPQKVNMLALTATATTSLRCAVVKALGMRQPIVISVPPDRPNIMFAVAPFKSFEGTFGPVADGLCTKKTSMPRMIIFCQRYQDCYQLYAYFKKRLGTNFTFPPDAPDLSKFRLVEMFTACTERKVKDQIIRSFTEVSSPLRIVIATAAFGMGIDCPNIRQVIHFGPTEDVESYVQESGRAGRDGKLACALLVSCKGVKHSLDKQMETYYLNSHQCRRELLFTDFDNYTCKHDGPLCTCCDVCAQKCNCKECSSLTCNFILPIVNK